MGRETDRDRLTDRQSDGEREGGGERHRERQRETDRRRERKTETDRHRDTETQSVNSLYLHHQAKPSLTFDILLFLLDFGLMYTQFFKLSL